MTNLCLAKLITNTALLFRKKPPSIMKKKKNPLIQMHKPQVYLCVLICVHVLLGKLSLFPENISLFTFFCVILSVKAEG